MKAVRCPTCDEPKSVTRRTHGLTLLACGHWADDGPGSRSEANGESLLAWARQLPPRVAPRAEPRGDATPPSGAPNRSSSGYRRPRWDDELGDFVSEPCESGGGDG
jgi:hypothetical protein